MLPDILMIVPCAVLTAIEDWVGMETLAREKEAWLPSPGSPARTAGHSAS